MSDAVDLARIQFATTTSFHFLFVMLTLGLVTLVAITQTRYTLSGNENRRETLSRMTRFWGHLYVINYALGIATGIVMEFQFGMNWSGLATVVGDVFGAPLAIETLVAFFLESTFLGLWIFGWGRLNKWLHLALIWLTALTAYASAFWIMVANAFMQNPVGYEVIGDGGDATVRLTDFGALLSNPMFGDALLHVVAGALVTGGVFMAGISALHFLRRTTEVEFFQRSLRLGLVTAAIAAPVLIGFGFAQFSTIDELQPGKVSEGGDAAAAAQAELVARYGPGDYITPEWANGLFGQMIEFGFLLTLALFAMVLMLFRGWLFRRRLPLRLLVVMIPIPFVAAISGWLFREVGRQPWLVYGLLRTEDAASHVSVGSMWVSLVVFTALFAALAVADWVLIARVARRGPAPAEAALPPRPVTPEPVAL
ncbi:cytochrome d ubiquinol oxidase subunit I [Herbihabitans rhizosphaerae]|uniref:Cytochrome d ubiquinol oxidase subunit I n=1 Tax=Herbihabitans rhizosphaerae TaxID=1872711 RepID=A0A4V2EUE7_9PSEU|nr:cytochrome ubiquinol oxidase subunit I [Herbihabitans rhizosphaerae]RZS44313.1 cytochrome d ubiquinol oxidase subunit I [Herbihabitans rhizosphaerae]